METRYTKDILWMKPFVDSVSDLIPTDTIPRIRSYRTAANRLSRSYGATIKYLNGRVSSITILTKTFREEIVNGKLKRKGYEDLPLYIILDTLAHELAHLVHWTHTPAHLSLQSRVMLRFARVIRKMGYEDIEQEAKEIQKG